MSLALGAVAVVIVTRLLGPAGYGQVAYATTIATLVVAVSASWTATAVTRYGREELEQRGTLRHASWNRLSLSLPLLLASAALVVGLQAAGALPEEIGWSLTAAALAASATLLLSEHLVNLLEAAGRMRLTAAALAVRAALAAGVLAAVAAGAAEASAALVVCVGAFASAAICLWLAVPLWRVAIWPPAIDRALARRMIAFSLPLIAFAASQYGMRTVDVVILRAFEPPRVVGTYAAAFQAYVMLSQLAATITIVLTPLFVSLEVAGRLRDVLAYLERLLPPLSLAICLAACVTAPAAAILVPIVLGDEFAGAADPIAILMPALALLGVASLAAPVLTLYERSSAIAAANVAALAVNVVGDVLLIGVLGLGATGPAVATAAAMAVLAGVYCVVAARCTGIPVRPPVAGLLAAAGGAIFSVGLPGGWALGAAGLLAAGTLVWARRRGVLSSADAELVGLLGLSGRPARAIAWLLAGRSRP